MLLFLALLEYAQVSDCLADWFCCVEASFLLRLLQQHQHKQMGQNLMQGVSTNYKDPFNLCKNSTYGKNIVDRNTTHTAYFTNNLSCPQLNLLRS